MSYIFNYDNYHTYTVDGHIFLVKPQNGACANYPCPYCGQNALHFLEVNDKLASNPPQYKMDIACYNPCCPGRHDLSSGIIIDGYYKMDRESAITSTIKKLIDPMLHEHAIDKIVSSKDSTIKEPEFTPSQSETPIMDIVKIPENNRPVLYTECWCNSPYHSIRWHIYDIDECYRPALTFECYLNPTISFWQRVKNAWNYIFNNKYVNGGFDFFEISKEDLPKLKSLIEQVEQKNNEK